MKFLKRLAVLCMALTLCFGAGAALTACGGNNNDSSSATSSSEESSVTESSVEESTSDSDSSSNSGTVTPIADGYTFKIFLNNDTPAAQYRILLCVGEACGTPVAADDNGIVKYPSTMLPAPQTAGAYSVHVMLPDWSETDYLEHIGTKTTTAEQYGTKIIQIKLK